MPLAPLQAQRWFPPQCNSTRLFAAAITNLNLPYSQQAPRGTPLSLSPEFYDAPSKRTQWTAFIRKSGLQSETLGEVVANIKTFLLPIIVAIQKGVPFNLHWNAGGSWQQKQ